MTILILPTDKASGLIEMLAVRIGHPQPIRLYCNSGYELFAQFGLGCDIAARTVCFHCCRFLDLYLQPGALLDLLEMLNDSDERVRMATLHTLACDRCKERSRRPEEVDVPPRVIQLLASDPSSHVRAMAIEVVGQFVHRSSDAAGAIEAAVRSDESYTVRKKQDGMSQEGLSTEGSRRRNTEEFWTERSTPITRTALG